ncbi:cupin domain-containing protein [Conexibacter sp. JD483]|uniref:cupin domain-containing protein n=1 Tax=unclassified Conexibacter TaxID=2627773 RepID=UPI00271848C1|nr:MULTISPECIES: cupin domain-containing protein [unclassified Conexibacter]MDO8186610.1 cupin domain-containing protein [Conexibacter sp. CPCC 205706]MDO8196715.1 cupin domain-containing protein [Conexibacter sp. CPCC 205762]MDR9370918.1 cupin domain-containing protein [Conexibacter sp. JD483]
MSYTVLSAADAFWRPSNQLGVLNTDLAKQLGATAMGARMWHLRPGQASTWHRHGEEQELYVVLEGTGRVRIGGGAAEGEAGTAEVAGAERLTLPPLSALLVQPRTLRQVFNDTDADVLWLVVGAPPEPANTLEMTPERLADMYPEGPRSLPPELRG